ncbi:MAG: hypothetical protein Q7S04_04355 [Candidatus Moranbacteria bacterium]|nr:hypothetical protein [Candidatus Moranbacteria bacterium]
MLEKLPFRTFILSAWQATLSKKLPWIFGTLLAIAGVIESRISLTLPDTTSFPEFLNSISEKSEGALLSFLLIFVFLFGLEIFGKGNLIASLSFVTGKTHLPSYPVNARAIGKNFIRTFSLECLTLIFLLAVIGIFSLPFLIASSQNPGVMTTLLQLGFLAFIPIAIAIFFVSRFALFYLLLSPLKIRGSIETGGALFSRFIFQSLLFGLFSFILTILFTFFVNTIILGIVTLSKKIGIPFEETSIALIVGLAFFTWFSIFQQALWLAFFKSIAGQDETTEFAKEKESVFDNHTLPETPPAQ